MAKPYNVTGWRTLERGIRVREHGKRMHRGKPDVYFALRFKVDGRSMEQGLGWASDGWTLTKARDKLHEFNLAAKSGNGPCTLKDERKVAQAEQEAQAKIPTLQVIWEAYQQTLTPKMASLYRSFCHCHIGDVMKMRAADLRTHHIDAIRAKLEAKDLSPQTVKHNLAFIRQLVRWGAKRGYCEMPTLDKLTFEMPTFDNTKTEFLKPDEIERLLAGLAQYPDQVLAGSMRLALYTGMRRGAILALEWQDIDFERKTICLRGENAKSGKTSFIPLNAEAEQELRAVEKLTKHASSLVFGVTDANCRAMRRFRRYAKQFLPEGYRPYYSLRHTFASILANAGVSPLTLQKVMTHSTINMVQRYAHLQPDALFQASSAIITHLNCVKRKAQIQ